MFCLFVHFLLSLVHLLDVVSFDRDLDVGQVEAVGQGGPLEQGLLQLLEAGVRDATFVHVYYFEVVAEGTLGLDQVGDFGIHVISHVRGVETVS